MVFENRFLSHLCYKVEYGVRKSLGPYSPKNGLKTCLSVWVLLSFSLCESRSSAKATWPTWYKFSQNMYLRPEKMYEIFLGMKNFNTVFCQTLNPFWNIYIFGNWHLGFSCRMMAKSGFAVLTTTLKMGVLT